MGLSVLLSQCSVSDHIEFPTGQDQNEQYHVSRVREYFPGPHSTTQLGVFLQGIASSATAPPQPALPACVVLTESADTEG